MLFVFIGIESSVLFVGLLYISFIVGCKLRKEPERSACFFTSGHERNTTDQLASPTLGRHWDFPHRNTSHRRSYPIRSFFASVVSTMAETTELIKLLAEQIQVQRQQMEQQAQFMERQSQQHREKMDQQAQQMQNLLKILDVQKHGTGEDDSSTHHPQLSTAAVPPFTAFDSTSELWPDY